MRRKDPPLCDLFPGGSDGGDDLPPPPPPVNGHPHPGGKPNRNGQIVFKFKTFHQENPHVFEKFEAVALEMVGRGYDHYGSGAIFERARWHSSMQTTDEHFKLCHDYRAYYSRLFHLKHPEHNKFFRIRKLRSMEKPPHKTDIVRIDGPPENEEQLLNFLAKLL